jgi:hypothetical protein
VVILAAIRFRYERGPLPASHVLPNRNFSEAMPIGLGVNAMAGPRFTSLVARTKIIPMAKVACTCGAIYARTEVKLPGEE